MYYYLLIYEYLVKFFLGGTKAFYSQASHDKKTKRNYNKYLLLLWRSLLFDCSAHIQRATTREKKKYVIRLQFLLDSYII